MEEVEEANRAAVECCQRVLNRLSQPQEQLQYMNLDVDTGETVAKFKKVVSLLGTGLGHVKVKRQKGTPLPFHHKFLVESPVACRSEPSLQSVQQLHPKSLTGTTTQRLECNAGIPYHQFPQKIFMENPMLEMEPVSRISPPRPQMVPSTHLQFFQQQHQQHGNQRLQFQQRMKLQDMFRRSNSSINLKFDSSSVTPTMSSTRSFLSSLSMDGSVTKMEGKSFSLIGAPQTSDRVASHPHLKRRCTGAGEDGSGKCVTSGKCHCSKRSRKLRLRTSIKVPAISNKLADIPPDEYSWRKYGQKPIKGSPHPRDRLAKRLLDNALLVKGMVRLHTSRKQSSPVFNEEDKAEEKFNTVKYYMAFPGSCA